MPPLAAGLRAGGAVGALLVLAAACTDLPVHPRADLPAAGASLSTTDLNATPPGHIRIGVVPDVSSLSVGGTGEFVVRDKATGAVLLTGNGAEATVTLESVLLVKRYYRLQVSCAGSETFRTNWIAAVTAAGYEPYTEFVASANCWRLRVGRITEAQYLNVAFRDAWKAEVIAKGLSPSGGGFWTSFTETEGELRFRVVLGTTEVLASNPVRVGALSGWVTFGGRRYRGVGDVVVNGAGRLAGVNELPLEEYLYGVVPRELPPTIWDEPEAQKAQAVAARTYAVRGLGKRRADGYDLLPTVTDQVYGGLAAEHPLSTAAVQATDGLVATYNGALIEALFSSTSGGHTASNEEVYASAPVPYLRGVPDAERGNSFAHVPTLEVFKAHANPASLRAMREGDFDSDWSRYHRWTFEWTAAEIRDVLSAWRGTDVGRVLAVNVLERGPSGRVLRIEYVTETGTFTDTKDRIRSSLKFINASGGMSSLLSTLFFIEPVRDPRTGETTGFRAYGGGWGHGVGLSQTGAQGMAVRGRSFQEILSHYYQGITLERRGG